MNHTFPARRQALRALAGFVASSPLYAQREIPDARQLIPSMDEMINVFDFEPVCKARVLKTSYDYVAGGADNEWTLRRNREAFDKWAFRPRMLVNTAALDLSTTLFGTRVEAPILIAPTAGHGQMTADGELATARAAAATKTLMVLSTNSSQPYEKVAAASEFPKWFQLYAGPDMDGTWERVERAKASGFQAIVFTVDGPYNPRRERMLRNRIETATPPGVGAQQRAQPAQTGRAARRQRDGEEAPRQQTRAQHYGLGTTLVHQLDWAFIAELKKRAAMPVMIKGILTAEDTALAVKYGADGVVVSNHGARYLDYAPATIEVLGECVDAAGGRMPVFVDGGFRRGTDVLKALALGAKAVLVGRPTLWGLGAYGEAGCRRVLEMLRTELALAMGLCGKANLAAIDRKLLRTL
ncbi:MAG: alpha-hydroxy-acid oxidizing protein [Bryobacterales bacterium]|nr:alpha-hydroxy-acid oxidizing protein [Bryobacterales bacterium]